MSIDAGRSASDLAQDHYRARPDTASVLVLSVSPLPDQGQVHDRDNRRITRWEHEAVLEAMQARLERMPEAARIRRQTAEHVFGTLKSWMGATHFLMKRLPNVRTEMSLHVLAYNMKRAMQIFGVVPLMQAIRA
jgi:hypothetical protein